MPNLCVLYHSEEDANEFQSPDLTDEYRRE
jgi:hypothetical protein